MGPPPPPAGLMGGEGTEESTKQEKEERRCVSGYEAIRLHIFFLVISSPPE